MSGRSSAYGLGNGLSSTKLEALILQGRDVVPDHQVDSRFGLPAFSATLAERERSTTMPFLPTATEALRTATNNSGGIQGGNQAMARRSFLRCASRPRAIDRKEQQTNRTH